MQIITDLTELNKAIDHWGHRGAKWVKEGQTLGLSALKALADHGDIGPCNRLYVSMPKGTKSGSMAAWLLAYGALRANEGTDRSEKPFLYDKGKAQVMGKAADLDGAAAHSWEMTGTQERTPLEVFDVTKALHSLLNRAIKAARVSNPKLVDALKELAEHPPEVEATEEQTEVQDRILEGLAESNRRPVRRVKAEDAQP